MLVVLKDGEKVFEGKLYSVAEYLGISAVKLAWLLHDNSNLEVEILTKYQYKKTLNKYERG